MPQAEQLIHMLGVAAAGVFRRWSRALSGFPATRMPPRDLSRLVEWFDALVQAAEYGTCRTVRARC